MLFLFFYFLLLTYSWFIKSERIGYRPCTEKISGVCKDNAEIIHCLINQSVDIVEAEDDCEKILLEIGCFQNPFTDLVKTSCPKAFDKICKSSLFTEGSLSTERNNNIREPDCPQDFYRQKEKLFKKEACKKAVNYYGCEPKVSYITDKILASACPEEYYLTCMRHYNDFPKTKEEYYKTNKFDHKLKISYVFYVCGNEDFSSTRSIKKRSEYPICKGIYLGVEYIKFKEFYSCWSPNMKETYVMNEIKREFPFIYYNLIGNPKMRYELEKTLITHMHSPSLSVYTMIAETVTDAIIEAKGDIFSLWLLDIGGVSLPDYFLDKLSKIVEVLTYSFFLDDQDRKKAQQQIKKTFLEKFETFLKKKQPKKKEQIANLMNALKLKWSSDS